MKKKVSYSLFSQLITLAASAVFLTFGIMFLNDGHTFNGLFLIGALLLCAVFSLFYAPVSIEADKDYLRIRRPLRSTLIPLSNIESVSYAPPTMGARRICASGGFMGYWGWFNERTTGNYFGYFGRSSQTFLIILRNGRRYMIGCDDNHEMADFIAQHLKVQN